MKLKSLYSCAIAALFAVSLGRACRGSNALPDTIPGGKSDNAPHPLGKKQAELRKQGLHKVLKGQAQTKGKNKVVEVAKGQFVELARQGEDKIFTIVGAVRNRRIPFPILGPARRGRYAIRFRNRTVRWTTRRSGRADFNQAYYTNLLFSDAPGAVSMRNYYIEQSSNRYTVNGDVTDWVQVPVQRSATTAPTTAATSSARRRGCSSRMLRTPGTTRRSRGEDARADQRVPVAVRRLGSLRLQRRRQLQRAGRLHRPLPDRPRG